MKMRSTGRFVLFFLVLFNISAFLSVSEVLAFSGQNHAHPTSDNNSTTTDPDFILKPPGYILERGTKFCSSLALIDTVVIGVADGRRYEMLGDATDLEFDSNGRIIALDCELVKYCSTVLMGRTFDSLCYQKL